MLYEFENGYNLNTGDLLPIFYASGVHLNKDVSLAFSIVDPQGKSILNDLELRENPLIKNISYDILDINGKTLYENYSQGLTRLFSLKELENISIFGNYTKDFGVRATVSNFINDNKFISEYYLYGNVPSILEVQVSDIEGTSITSGYQYYGIVDSEIINLEPTYDEIKVEVHFENKTQYLLYDSIDVYSATGKNPEIIDENFLYSAKVNNIDNVVLNIGEGYLNTGISYNLALVPFSKLGSGDAFYIGTHSLISSNTGIDYTPEETVTNNIQISNGLDSVKIDFITGSFISGRDEIIDIIEKNKYKTIKYTTQIINSNNEVSSSELKIVISNTGNDYIPSIIEYGFNDNNYMNYKLATGYDYIYLIADGASMPANFKLYKTLM